jgi:hypothetical protein
MEDFIPEIAGLNVDEGKVRDEVTAIQTVLQSRQGGIRLQTLLYTKLTLGVFSDLLGIEAYRLIMPVLV